MLEPTRHPATVPNWQGRSVVARASGMLCQSRGKSARHPAVETTAGDNREVDRGDNAEIA